MKLIIILAALVIIVHCTYIISRLNHRSWCGHKLLFIGLSFAYAMIAGGAIGLVLGWPPAVWFLLFGVAGRVLFDRRKRA